MYTLKGNAAHLLFYCIKPVTTSIFGHACSCMPCSLYLCLMIPCLTTIEHCSVWVVMVRKLMPILFNNSERTTEYKKGGHITDPCTLTSLIFCATLTFMYLPALHSEHSARLLTEISSKSPGFKKCQPRCLNLNVAMPHSHKEHVQLFQMLVCICHTQDCLPAPVYLSVCPVNSPVIIHS